MGKPKDLTGVQFGKLLVIEKAQSRVYPCGAKIAMWRCKCACGKETVVTAQALLCGRTVSCGCHKRMLAALGGPNKTHGRSRTKLYRVWCGMKNRCYNSNTDAFKNYGFRGISVCEEWKENFANFSDWAEKNGYTEGLTIDRIDVNGNYSPGNCRWVSRNTQNNNTRRSVKVTYMGRTQSIKDWCNELNLNYKKIYCRIRCYGWAVKRALEKP